MNLENIGKSAPKPAVFNGCVQLSVNVEQTNRAGFCGLGRKNHLNNLRYLRGRWKTHRAATVVEHRAALTKNEGLFRYGY